MRLCATGRYEGHSVLPELIHIKWTILEGAESCTKRSPRLICVCNPVVTQRSNLSHHTLQWVVKSQELSALRACAMVRFLRSIVSCRTSPQDDDESQNQLDFSQRTYLLKTNIYTFLSNENVKHSVFNIFK